MPAETDDPALLSRQVAEVLGWRDLEEGVVSGRWYGRPPGQEHSYDKPAIPHYHASFDACERDLLPVLVERGWYAVAVETSTGGGWDCTLFHQGRERTNVEASGSCPAEALCHAFLAATSR